MQYIILACSGQKADERNHAIDLYQARQFKAVSDAIDDDSLVSILSAQHGLIADLWQVDPYDRTMTPERARDLAASEFDGWLFAHTAMDPEVDEILVYGGKLYRDVVKAWAEPWDIEVTELVGANRGCGDHFAALQEALA